MTGRNRSPPEAPFPPGPERQPRKNECFEPARRKVVRTVFFGIGIVEFLARCKTRNSIRHRKVLLAALAGQITAIGKQVAMTIRASEQISSKSAGRTHFSDFSVATNRVSCSWRDAETIAKCRHVTESSCMQPCGTKVRSRKQLRIRSFMIAIVVARLDWAAMKKCLSRPR